MSLCQYRNVVSFCPYYAYPYILLYGNEIEDWNERNSKKGPSGQIISLRAPDDKQSMSLDLMSGASVEEIQASLGGDGGICVYEKMDEDD